MSLQPPYSAMRCTFACPGNFLNFEILFYDQVSIYAKICTNENFPLYGKNEDCTSMEAALVSEHGCGHPQKGGQVHMYYLWT